MKKLMFAAAVAAGLVALGELSSVNTVGYINNANSVSGYFQRGSAFTAVGTTTDSASIQSITPQTPAGAVDALADGGAVIQEMKTAV